MALERSAPVPIARVPAHVGGLVCRYCTHQQASVRCLLCSPGLVYEFNGRRGLPPLLAFARGGYRSGAAHMMVPAEILADNLNPNPNPDLDPNPNPNPSQVPAEILADASIYWLLAEAMWPAVKQV